VLPLHPPMVLPHSTSRSRWLTALWIRITLAIAWPQGVLGEEDSLAVAAQVNGDVS
jgi:hypothetical protein